jgi:hypothetical protein
MLQTDELMSVTSRKAAAEVRVVVAVASLREAQRLIEEAAKALSGRTFRTSAGSVARI